MSYTYLIKCVPEERVYYGVRYAEGCNPNELFRSYFTSSKDVHQLIEKYGVDQFQTEIRQTFDNVESARKWENTVLRRCDVINNPRFINKTTNKSIDPKSAGHWKGKTGFQHNRFGKKNPKLSLINKRKTGESNPMYGKDKCTVCGKVFNKLNICRWHNANCKQTRS